MKDRKLNLHAIASGYCMPKQNYLLQLAQHSNIHWQVYNTTTRELYQLAKQLLRYYPYIIKRK